MAISVGNSASRGGFLGENRLFIIIIIILSRVNKKNPPDLFSPN